MQKSEQPTLLYKQVKRMIRQLQLEYSTRESASSTGGSVPVGNTVITAMLQTFRAFYRGDFMNLSRVNKHHLTMCVLQHTKGLRFAWTFHAQAFPCVRHCLARGRLSAAYYGLAALPRETTDHLAVPVHAEVGVPDVQTPRREPRVGHYRFQSVGMAHQWHALS